VSIIRKATIQDLNGINAVIKANQLEKDACYKFPYFFGNSRDILPTKNQIIFVTLVNENEIAFLSLHNNNLFEKDSEAKFEMVVHPDHRDRKKHYGENLLRHVINYAEVETNIILLVGKVLKKNIPSINLLLKCGFSCDKHVNNDGGYVMKLNINR